MATTSLLLAVAPLTDSMPEADEVKPGWVALVVVLLLCLATAFLWLNMRKQLNKINFDEGDEGDGDGSQPETREPGDVGVGPSHGENGAADPDPPARP